MTNNNSKKVLVIAGEYPPIKTIGRIRTAKFVMHLRSMGWTPYVLTMEYDKNNPLYSPSLEEEVPKDTAVFRVPNATIDDTLIGFIKQLLGSSTSNQASTSKQASTKEDKQTASQKSFKQRVIDSLKSFTRNWLHIPDDQIIWANRSYKVALDIIEKEDIDLIYTSFPPFSAAITGYKLKKKTGLPWVVDYRDLWTGDVLREWISSPRQYIESKLEKKIIRKADCVIAVSEQKTSFLKNFLPSTISQWHTVTNGYDIEEFEALLSQPRPNTDHINFVYTGRLFKNRKGYSIVHALGKIKNELPELVAKVRVNFYGGLSPEIQSEYDKLIKQYGLHEHFIFHGDVDFETAKKAQVEADFLLLIVDTGATADGVIPGKLFEYVASKRPIFALCDSAATTEIILKAKIGVVTAVNDIEQCKECLQKILKDKTYSDLTKVDIKYLEQFDRKHLTQRLANIFNSLVDNH